MAINPTTYNDVCNKFRQIANSHLNVKQFKIGPPSDIEVPTNADPISKYPYVHLVPNPSEIVKGGIVYNFSMVVMDLAKDTEDREQRTHSNMLNVLLDIISKLKLTKWSDVEMDVELPLQIVPFVEAQKHSVTGWTAEIRVITRNPLNICDAAFEN